LLKIAPDETALLRTDVALLACEKQSSGQN
jgi:hypothetical protein